MCWIVVLRVGNFSCLHFRWCKRYKLQQITPITDSSTISRPVPTNHRTRLKQRNELWKCSHYFFVSFRFGFDCVQITTQKLASCLIVLLILWRKWRWLVVLQWWSSVSEGMRRRKTKSEELGSATTNSLERSVKAVSEKWN